MSEEDGFLGKLLEQPNSDLTRLVCADWLDERGTTEASAKAEFLRLTTDPELSGRFADRANTLAQQLDPKWLAAVSKLPIENCDLSNSDGLSPKLFAPEFDFECPKRWEELTPTEDGSNIRFCGECHKTVHYCHDADSLRWNANLGNCVAVELGVPRRPGDLEPEPMMRTMGIIAYDDFNPDSPEQVRKEGEPRRSWWSRLWRRRGD